MLVHVGTGEIEFTLTLSAHAARVGAHAVSSLPPKGDFRAVYSFYERLAKESTLPLILYYFPQLCPDAFPSEADLFEVCELPNVLGVKFTDYNLFLLQQLVERGLTVYNGRDEIYAAGLLMGASGRKRFYIRRPSAGSRRDRSCRPSSALGRGAASAKAPECRVANMAAVSICGRSETHM